MQLSFDLSSPPPPREPKKKEPEVLRVQDLTRRIKRLLESQIGQVWVQGEVSNHRKHSSGHHYFTLKDASAQLSCVLFAGDARLCSTANLRDGVEIQIAGDLSVYEARGQYQMIVRLIREQGAGALQAQFEALKQKLAAEGLFASERKRPLPKYPRCVAVVTSATGAALRDFLDVLWRRNPHVEVLLHHVPVQGAGAASKIAAAIQTIATLPHHLPQPEVLVLTRGGGSMEDLWQFNEEIVARAIAASRIPVISAIGHEIDFTIADFVADLRAPTPSAAAELLTAESAQLRVHLASTLRRLRRACDRTIDKLRKHLARTARAQVFRHPQRLLETFRQDLDGYQKNLITKVLSRFQEQQREITKASAVLRAHHPAKWIPLQEERLAKQIRRLQAAATAKLDAGKEKLRVKDQLLKVLGPTATLARGYTLTFDTKGNLIKNTAAAHEAKNLITKFADGEVRLHIKE